VLKHPGKELVVLAPHLGVVAKSQVDEELTQVLLNVLVKICFAVQLQEVLQDHLVYNGTLVVELLLELSLVEG